MRVEVTLPPGAHLLPPGANVQAWTEAVLGTVPAAGRAAVARHLALLATRREDGPASRGWLAVLAPEDGGGSGRPCAGVLAAGWIELGGPVNVEALAESMRAAELPGFVLSRSVELRESRRVPAVVCRDLLTSPSGESGTRLFERCSMVLVHRKKQISVEVEVSTSDLSVFEDLGSFCLEFAERIRPLEGRTGRVPGIVPEGEVHGSGGGVKR